MDGKAYPLISVITPAYNHEQYVQETIQSILDQDYPNIEYIIIDDGSRDDTYNKILQKQSFAKDRLARVIVKTKENEGIIRTLNTGLSLATGEYVYIIASDDKAAPDAITTLYNFLSDNDEYGLAVGDDYFMDEKGMHCYWDNSQNIVYNREEAKYTSFGHYLMSKRKDVDFNSEQFGTYETLLKGNYIPNGYLIRKSVIDAIGGYSKEGVLEDYFLMLQIAKISKLKFISTPLFNYRWHSANTVKQRTMIERLTYRTMLNEWDYIASNKMVQKTAMKELAKFTIYMYENMDQARWLKFTVNAEKNIILKMFIHKTIFWYNYGKFKSQLRKWKKRYFRIHNGSTT